MWYKMVEIWFPYGETKVFASLDVIRIAFEQNLSEIKKIDDKKVLEELTSKLHQVRARRLCIYYCTTNHPKIADLLNELLNDFSSSGGEFEIYLIGPRGTRVRNSLERLKDHQDAIRQDHPELCKVCDNSMYIGYALPSFLFGISGIGEAFLGLENKSISQEAIDELSARENNDKLNTSLNLISSVEESLNDRNLLSVVFLPGAEGVADMRVGNLREAAIEASNVFKEMYGMRMSDVDGLVVSLGGAPYDYSMSESLDMMVSAVHANKSIEYGFIAEWGAGLGDEKITESFKKSLRELRAQVLNRFDWMDLIVYALRTGEFLRGSYILTSLPHTLVKHTIGCKQCETANKLIQRVLHSVGDGKVGIIKSLPNVYLR
jgi:hypothetical protein